MNEYYRGFKSGIPICIGYIAVSFAFGVMAMNGGITPLATILISATNLTSAGQYAGVSLMCRCAGYLELFATMLCINLRYILMGLALSQKIDPEMPKWKRFLSSLYITDEVFSVSVTRKTKIKCSYMIGLFTLPILGWVTGTCLGIVSADFFPEDILAAVNISLYAMFIAAFLPPAKKERSILIVVLISAAISCILEYVPFINQMGLGFKVIIATIIAAIIGALLFPRHDEEDKEQ